MTLEDDIRRLVRSGHNSAIIDLNVSREYGVSLGVPGGQKYAVVGNTVEPLTEPVTKKEGVQ